MGKILIKNPDAPATTSQIWYLKLLRYDGDTNISKGKADAIITDLRKTTKPINTYGFLYDIWDDRKNLFHYKYPLKYVDKEVKKSIAPIDINNPNTCPRCRSNHCSRQPFYDGDDICLVCGYVYYYYSTVEITHIDKESFTKPYSDNEFLTARDVINSRSNSSKEYFKNYYSKNKDIISSRNKRYKDKNPKKIKNYNDKWRKENRDKYNSYFRERYRRIKNGL